VSHHLAGDTAICLASHGSYDLASSPSSQIQALRVIVKWTLQLGREKELGLRRSLFINWLLLFNRVIVKWTLQLGREKELGLRRSLFINWLLLFLILTGLCMGRMKNERMNDQSRLEFIIGTAPSTGARMQSHPTE
jgi:hypothetical protein